MSRRSTRCQRTRPTRPKPRLFAPNARSVRLASSTPWPTASVRAYGVGPLSGSVGASCGRGASQPDHFLVLALTVVVVVVVVVAGGPRVQGTGFQGSGCVLV